MTLAPIFPQKSFVTCCTRLLFLCGGYAAQDFTKKRPKREKTKAEKKKRLNFRSSIIIIITCRLAKGVCIILLALSIHQNIIHLVGALNVAFIIHPSIIMMSGLANTDSRQKLRKKGTKILITRFRFRRSSSSAAPGRRTQTPGPTSLPDLPPPPPGSLRYLPSPRK